RGLPTRGNRLLRRGSLLSLRGCGVALGQVIENVAELFFQRRPGGGHFVALRGDANRGQAVLDSQVGKDVVSVVGPLFLIAKGVVVAGGLLGGGGVDDAR